jgi:lysyl-tRNA synthetase class 2
MKICVDAKILKRFPETTIGILLAKVTVTKTHPQVEALKTTLYEMVNSFGIDASNLSSHPNILPWRKIYKEEFQVNPNKYPNAIESLVKRIVSGKPLWNISTIVDLYNCIAVQNLLPMGAYDVETIEGDIFLRYAKEGEAFQPLGSDQSILVQSNHIIYSDDKKVLTWLWNYKDSYLSSVTEKTQYALFFVDSICRTTSSGSVENALSLLKKHLETLNATVLQTNIMNVEVPVVQINLNDKI